MKGPREQVFTITVRNEFLRGSSAPLKSSKIAVLCMSDLTVETAATELRIINAIGLIGSWGGRDRVMALNDQRQDRHGPCADHRAKAAIRKV